MNSEGWLEGRATLTVNEECPGDSDELSGSDLLENVGLSEDDCI